MVIFIGTHLSPCNGLILRPTMKFRGIDLLAVGSASTVLQGNIKVFLGNLLRTKCSCLANRVTECWSLTVPILSGSLSPLHGMNLSRNVKLAGSSTRRTQITRGWPPITSYQSPAYTCSIKSSLTYVTTTRSASVYLSRGRLRPC